MKRLTLLALMMIALMLSACTSIAEKNIMATWEDAAGWEYIFKDGQVLILSPEDIEFLGFYEFMDKDTIKLISMNGSAEIILDVELSGNYLILIEDGERTTLTRVPYSTRRINFPSGNE
jgi:hypothetical protein